MISLPAFYSDVISGTQLDAGQYICNKNNNDNFRRFIMDPVMFQIM